MKKCVQCRTQIEEMVPMTVCCGGQGTIAKVNNKPDAFVATAITILSIVHSQVTAALDDKTEFDIALGVNKLGIGVAMNNTVPATPNTTAPHATHANVNNIQLDDVQKLQQQLQDIKEQVMMILQAFAVPLSLSTDR